MQDLVSKSARRKNAGAFYTHESIFFTVGRNLKQRKKCRNLFHGDYDIFFVGYVVFGMSPSFFFATLWSPADWLVCGKIMRSQIPIISRSLLYWHLEWRRMEVAGCKNAGHPVPASICLLCSIFLLPNQLLFTVFRWPENIGCRFDCIIHSRQKKAITLS